MVKVLKCSSIKCRSESNVSGAVLFPFLFALIFGEDMLVICYWDFYFSYMYFMQYTALLSDKSSLIYTYIFTHKLFLKAFILYGLRDPVNFTSLQHFYNNLELIITKMVSFKVKIYLMWMSSTEFSQIFVIWKWSNYVKIYLLAY